VLPLDLAAKDIVFVSILPQKFFVEQIAANLVDVRVMVEPGQAPETYEPSQRKMAELAQARLFFAIGLPFEEQLTKLIDSNKYISSAVDESRNSVAAEQGETEHSDEHEHEHGHHHNGDPHIWLDPIQVKQQAKIIYEQLSESFPAFKSKLQTNYQGFINRLVDLNNKIMTQLSIEKGEHFLIFHPALGHYAERYHLEQVAIENEGKLPSAKYIAQLLSQLNNRKVKYILVEKQFSQKAAHTIAKQLDADLLIIDPLAYSYFINMQNITDNVAKSLY